MNVYLLVELEAVPNAMFHVDPDEVWLGGGEHLQKRHISLISTREWPQSPRCCCEWEEGGAGLPL